MPNPPSVIRLSEHDPDAFRQLPERWVDQNAESDDVAMRSAAPTVASGCREESTINQRMTFRRAQARQKETKRVVEKCEEGFGVVGSLRTQFHSGSFRPRKPTTRDERLAG
jgi:hypothetical protein